MLKRFLNDHIEKCTDDSVRSSIVLIANHFARLKNINDIDVIRGIEGDCAGLYFGCFNTLITNPDKNFRFTGRNRRPPLDNVNAMLSFVYTMLANDCSSALETVGLDPAVGYLHRIRPGRMSLSLDIMEEFRAFLADRLVLSLINLKIVKKTGFKIISSVDD